MSDQFSRRDWMKVVGVAAAMGPVAPRASAAAAPRVSVAPGPPGEISDLVSTDDVFIPPRGRSFMKFSFDSPEPSVTFGGHRFSFLVFTEENAYSLDRAGMKAIGDGDALTLTALGLTWAGGQQKAPGRLIAKFTRTGTTIEWDITVEMDRAIKT